MIRSIRATLTLWYVSILAAILCLFGWVLYTSVSKNLAKVQDAGKKGMNLKIQHEKGVASKIEGVSGNNQTARAGQLACIMRNGIPLRITKFFTWQA